MEAIYKIWYKTADKKSVDALYRARFEGETTQKLGLTIHPMDYEGHFELYYVPTVALMQKIEQVGINDSTLRQLQKALPGVARERFLVEMIAEELQSSNEIEGVKSNKHDIAESTRQIKAGERPDSPRMHSMIESYLRIEDGRFALPETPQDIRHIYDDITEGEIAAENLPDGEIFVSEGAEVTGAAYGKTIHKGVYGEAAIVSHVAQLLALLARDDVPFLLKLAAAHYYFGYIHPFYDGNGRTNRFITSLYLSKRYSAMTAYSFSTGCRLAHKKYLELFDKTNKFNAYGEMNHAMMLFLDIILTGQQHLQDHLSEKVYLLHHAEQLLKADARLVGDELAQTVVYLFCQAHFFADGVFARNDLTALLKGQNKKWTKEKCYACFEAFEARGWIETVGRKPVQYRFNNAYLQQ